MANLNPHETLPFDLKFLLWGRSGTGKTYLPATYTKGPIHYYFFDPGGHKTLIRAFRDGHTHVEKHTYDYFIEEQRKPGLPNPKAWSNFFAKFCKDAESGLFNKLAEESGILVVDSLSSAADACLDHVLKMNARLGKSIRVQDWGSLTSLMKEFIRYLNFLPCSVVLTAHEADIKDENGNVIKIVPSIAGQLKERISLWFDEVWRYQMMAGKRRLNFVGTNVWESKSRIFTAPYMENLSMDDIYTAYVNLPK